MTPLAIWKLTLSGSYLKLTLEPEAMDFGMVAKLAGASPPFQVAARSSVNLPGGFRADAMFRWVDALDSAQGQPNPSYAELDARLAWQGGRNIEISVVGRSLLHDRHTEFPGGTALPRSVYGKLAAWF